MDLIGRPPINRVAFVAGKVAAVGCWLAFPARFVLPELAGQRAPGQDWLALGTLLIGLAILIAALVNLGDSTRVGLPREATALKTGGLYRFSRNPVYVGLHLTTLAAVVYAPHPAVLLLFAVAVAVHHRIILAEERFLDGAFGQEWRVYARRVRRYL
jgi:protein-S-isoprenylcysteine O-methyltransferase Ste14